MATRSLQTAKNLERNAHSGVDETGYLSRSWKTIAANIM